MNHLKKKGKVMLTDKGIEFAKKLDTYGTEDLPVIEAKFMQ
jgi:hypothetical protein